MITVNFYKFNELSKEIQQKIIKTWKYDCIFQSQTTEAIITRLRVFNTGNFIQTNWLRHLVAREMIEVNINWGREEVILLRVDGITLGDACELQEVKADIENELTKQLREYTHPDSLVNSIHEQEKLHKLVFSIRGNRFYEDDLI